METWSVDPDRVLGIVRGVDDQGVLMESGAKDVRTLALNGGDELSIDGRAVLTTAWREFWEGRQDLPGKAMYGVFKAAEGVSAATDEVINGDEAMSKRTVAEILRSRWNMIPTDESLPSGLTRS